MVSRYWGIVCGAKLILQVPRMQFYAIEIARNRNGLNDWIYENNQKEQTKAKEEAGKSES